MNLLSAIFKHCLPSTNTSAPKPRENAAADAAPRAATPTDKGAPKRLEERYPEVRYPKLHKLCREMRVLEKQVAKHKWTYEPDFPAHPDDFRVRKFFPDYHPVRIRWVIQGERELERKKEEINRELFMIHLKHSDVFVIDENKLGRGTGRKCRTRKEAGLTPGKMDPLREGVKVKGKKVDAVPTDSSTKETTAHMGAGRSNKNVGSKKGQSSRTLNDMKSGGAVIPSSTARTPRPGKTPSGSPRAQPSQKRESLAKNVRPSRHSGGEISPSSSGGSLRSSSVSSEQAVVLQTFTVKPCLSNQQSPLSEDAAGLFTDSRQQEVGKATAKEAWIDEGKMSLFIEALPTLQKVRPTFLLDPVEVVINNNRKGEYRNLAEAIRCWDWSMRAQAALQTLSEFYSSAIAEYQAGNADDIIVLLSEKDKIDVYLGVYQDTVDTQIAEMERLYGSKFVPQGSRFRNPVEIIGLPFTSINELLGKKDVEEIRGVLKKFFDQHKADLEKNFAKMA